MVEIAPTYDPAGITALAGVSVLHELLAALADTRRSGRPAPSSHHVAGRRMSPEGGGAFGLMVKRHTASCSAFGG